MAPARVARPARVVPVGPAGRVAPPGQAVAASRRRAATAPASPGRAARAMAALHLAATTSQVPAGVRPTAQRPGAAAPHADPIATSVSTDQSARAVPSPPAVPSPRTVRSRGRRELATTVPSVPGPMRRAPAGGQYGATHDRTRASSAVLAVGPRQAVRIAVGPRQAVRIAVGPSGVPLVASNVR